MLQAVRELLAPIGRWNAEPEVLGAKSWPRSLPQFDVSHLSVQRSVAAAKTAEPRVGFCGAWINGGSVGQVMSGGMAAADQVATALRGE